MPMSVHVDELHTDVMPAGGSTPASRSGEDTGGDTIEERIAEAQRRAECLARRVAAEGFDD
jgi:hypothetical protein